MWIARVSARVSEGGRERDRTLALSFMQASVFENTRIELACADTRAHLSARHVVDYEDNGVKHVLQWRIPASAAYDANDATHSIVVADDSVHILVCDSASLPVAHTFQPDETWRVPDASPEQFALVRINAKHRIVHVVYLAQDRPVRHRHRFGCCWRARPKMHARA